MTREDARKSLVLALKGMVVRGEIRTAVEYLVQLLETDDFKKIFTYGRIPPASKSICRKYKFGKTDTSSGKEVKFPKIEEEFWQY